MRLIQWGVNKGSMAGQDSNDRIAELLKQAYPPAAASPEFKAKLRQHLNEQAGALGTESPKPLWQQPFVWATAGAAAAMAIAVVVYFVVFHSVPLNVTTSYPTSIQATTATLNANLDGLGAADSVDVSFEWGTTTDYGNETTPVVRTENGGITADLSGLAPNTTYHFRVKAVGRHGTVYGPDMQFTTGPAPPVATTSDAAKIKTTSATLRGTLDDLGSAASVSVSFEWGLTISYGNETTPESKTATGKYDADLSGLTPNTTYHFRAKAVGHGTTYGADAQFTTKTVPPSVETNDATNIGTSSARLNGELTLLGTASSVGVSFEYGTATGSYTQTTADQARPSTGAFSADLSGLTPGTTYYYRAKADGDGPPMYGEEKSFIALTTPPAVTTDGASNVATTSATLNGELTALGTAITVNVSFEWGTATGSYTHTTPDQARTSTAAFTADLNGLTPGATYYYRAKAVGDGISYGAETSFTALVPPSVTTSSATEVHSKSVTLNGILDSLGTAGSVNVYFEWGTTTSYDNQTVPQPKNATGGFSAILTGLTPNTTYHFRTKAVGDGIAYGADMMFTTSNTPPAQNTWYLSKDVSGPVKVMYDADTSKPTEIVQLRHSGPTSRIWRANESSRETTYPAGNWTVQLTLGDFEIGHTDNVEIGTWDGNVFTPYGVYIIRGLGQGNEVYVVSVNISVGSFTVPSGGYVAVRMTVTSSPQWLDVHVGGSQSYVTSPAYPEPTAPAVTTNAATTVEQTAATLNGSLDSLGTAGSVMVYFEWGTTTDYGNQIDVGARTSGGNFSAPLAGLTPNTTYHFRAKTVGDGTNYGVDMVFTTPP